MSRFKKAERKQAKLRLGLTGTSGSGKTHSALLLAAGIGGRIAVIDTERASAHIEVGKPGIPSFDALELNAPFTPEAYIEAIHDAEAAGYDILIIDSITHEWSGKGGILEIHDVVTRTKARGNSYTAWGEVTPRHNAFIDAILQANMHVIVTMRSKADFVLVEEKGKQVPKKVGLAPVQREGFEYELTVCLDIDKDGHLATTSKDRTGLFIDPLTLSAKDGQRLRQWLDSGVNVDDLMAAEVSALTHTLELAAERGTVNFRKVWVENDGPVRARVLADDDTMKLLQDACVKADQRIAAEQQAQDDADAARHQQEQERQAQEAV